MKTTLEIPDALFHEAKEYAAARGIPFREVVEVSLRSHLEAVPAKPKPFKVRKVAPWHSEALVDPSDWPAIRAILYEGRGE